MKQKTLIEIDEILFEYDGPYLFTGTDEQNNKYLNIQCNIDKNIVDLSVPISQQEIIDIKLASRSVDSIFLKDNTTIYKGDFVEYCDELESFPYTLDEGLKKAFFDGTFYLDPEDYEEELTPCTPFLRNDSHISTVWEEEHSKTEKINYTSISPLVKFNKDSNKDGELRFSYNSLYSIEMQHLENHAA
ncbi:hypothetical protein GUA89_26870 [Escherichia coli]|nr:hypothetical protein [Escherichia coli]